MPLGIHVAAKASAYMEIALPLILVYPGGFQGIGLRAPVQAMPWSGRTEVSLGAIAPGLHRRVALGFC